MSISDEESTDKAKLRTLLDRNNTVDNLTRESPESLNGELERCRVDFEWITSKLRLNEGATSEEYHEARKKVEAKIHSIEEELSRRRESGVMY
jgi:hypothetical protein